MPLLRPRTSTAFPFLQPRAIRISGSATPNRRSVVPCQPVVLSKPLCHFGRTLGSANANYRPGLPQYRPSPIYQEHENYGTELNTAGSGQSLFSMVLQNQARNFCGNSNLTVGHFPAFGRNPATPVVFPERPNFGSSRPDSVRTSSPQFLTSMHPQKKEEPARRPAPPFLVKRSIFHSPACPSSPAATSNLAPA